MDRFSRLANPCTTATAPIRTTRTPIKSAIHYRVENLSNTQLPGAIRSLPGKQNASPAITQLEPVSDPHEADPRIGRNTRLVGQHGLPLRRAARDRRLLLRARRGV